MITQEQLQALVGTRFPGGSYTPEPYVNWLTCDCVVAPELIGAASAHPLLVYMATQAGTGLSLEELFALFLGRSEDGPMLGEWGMEVFTPVQVGVDYAVAGGITAVQRKVGKKTGTFDIITFELELRPSGRPEELHAVTRSSFIFPEEGLMQIEVGMSLPSRTVEHVDIAHMKTMAALLSDPNPIHWDVGATKALGLGDRTVNQGPINMAYVMNMLIAWADDEPGRLRALNLRFMANVFDGDRVVAGGSVIGLRVVDGELLADCEVWLDVDGAGRALSGTATVLVD